MRRFFLGSLSALCLVFILGIDSTPWPTDVPVSGGFNGLSDTGSIGWSATSNCAGSNGGALTISGGAVVCTDDDSGAATGTGTDESTWTVNEDLDSTEPADGSGIVVQGHTSNANTSWEITWTAASNTVQFTALAGGETYDFDGAVTATSFQADDLAAEPGNRVQINDNDTAFTNDPNCTNSGEAGELTIIDVDEGASELWRACDGTSPLFDFKSAAFECATIEDLANGDDNFPVWATYDSVTIQEAFCVCNELTGSACTGTLAQISFEDGAGNAMTGNVTCEATADDGTFTSISAGNSLTPGEVLAFDVDNSITDTGSDEYTICWRYTWDD